MQLSMTYFVPFDFPSQKAMTSSAYSIIEYFYAAVPISRTFYSLEKIQLIFYRFFGHILSHKYLFPLRLLKQFPQHHPE